VCGVLGAGVSALHGNGDDPEHVLAPAPRTYAIVDGSIRRRQ
jgi:hypothetical protein